MGKHCFQHRKHIIRILAYPDAQFLCTNLHLRAWCHPCFGRSSSDLRWLWPDGPWPADHNQLVIDEHGDIYENLADYGEEEQLYKKTPNSFHAHPWVAVDRNDWSKWYTHIHALIMRARLYDIAAKWVYYLKEEKARDDRAEFEEFLKKRNERA